MTVVFLREGEGIRNEHVIKSFFEVSAVWGTGGTLYLDNGSEYKCADFIADAVKLANRDGRKVIVRAKPYNPRAKIIEGIFSVFRHYWSKQIGDVGGNRITAKTANIGREQDPFPGTFAQLVEMVNATVTVYHNRPQSKKGQLAGRSPNQAYNDALAEGWAKTEVDPYAFFTAFSTEETREGWQGRISVKGRFWTCDALCSYARGRVIVLIPKFEQWDRLPVKDERGRLLGFAEPEKPYDFLDPAGAKESARRQKLRVVAVRELDASAPTIDPLTDTLDLARELPKEAPAPIGALVTASDHARAIAQGVKESPKAKRAREEAERKYEADVMHELMVKLKETQSKTAG